MACLSVQQRMDTGLTPAKDGTELGYELGPMHDAKSMNEGPGPPQKLKDK